MDNRNIQEEKAYISGLFTRAAPIYDKVGFKSFSYFFGKRLVELIEITEKANVLDIAAGRGLRLPLVYNTCGFERLEILKKLDGIVDIYLPDFKYSDGKMAAKYSSEAETYPEVTKAALLEMHRQVGVAKPAGDGLMYRGLMIRHLVMPNDVSGTKGVIEWIAENLPQDTYLNIMSQYRPMYKASEYKEIARKITRSEYRDAVKWAKEAGLTNLEIQGYRF